MRVYLNKNNHGIPAAAAQSPGRVRKLPAATQLLPARGRHTAAPRTLTSSVSVDVGRRRAASSRPGRRVSTSNGPPAACACVRAVCVRVCACVGELRLLARALLTGTRPEAASSVNTRSPLSVELWSKTRKVTFAKPPFRGRLLLVSFCPFLPLIEGKKWRSCSGSDVVVSICIQPKLTNGRLLSTKPEYLCIL